MSLTHLDLFAGLGAFSLGFESEGFSTIAQVEIDKNCQKLLNHRFPGVHHWPDVTTFNQDTIACPSVVTFGSPCQDLSVAGQRAGMAGERSGLFYHATRIIQRLVGRGLEFALWENVEGAFSSNSGRDFAGVIAELAECGAMDIGWRVLDCQYFGLAQRRRRVFVVADFRGQRAAQVLSFSEGLQGHPAPCREAGQRVANCFTAGARSGSYNGQDVGNMIPIPVVANPVGHHHRRDDLDNDTYIPVVAKAITAERDGYNDGSDQTYVVGFSAKDSGHDAVQDLAPTLRSGNHKDANANGGCGPAVCFSSTMGGNDGGVYHDGSTSTVCPNRVPAVAFPQNMSSTQRASSEELSPAIQSSNPTAVAFQSRIARNGRGQPEEICPALRGSVEGDTADSKPLAAGNFGVRRLTPTECERLMGLPDGWTSGFSDSVRYRMIGNSAAVPAIRWLAKAMAEQWGSL